MKRFFSSARTMAMISGLALASPVMSHAAECRYSFGNVLAARPSVSVVLPSEHAEFDDIGLSLVSIFLRNQSVDCKLAEEIQFFGANSVGIQSLEEFRGRHPDMEKKLREYITSNYPDQDVEFSFYDQINDSIHTRIFEVRMDNGLGFVDGHTFIEPGLTAWSSCKVDLRRSDALARARMIVSGLSNTKTIPECPQ
ncbi:hypothetical protein [Halovulum sp. GXIMD14793]